MHKDIDKCECGKDINLNKGEGFYTEDGVLLCLSCWDDLLEGEVFDEL